MSTNTQRYRRLDIVKLPRSMTHIDGRPYVVQTLDGRRLSKHSCLADAKAEIDRIKDAGKLSRAQAGVADTGFTGRPEPKSLEEAFVDPNGG
jgi:hypothetical protein